MKLETQFLAKKSYAFGGLTEPLGDEEGELLPLGPVESIFELDFWWSS